MILLAMGTRPEIIKFYPVYKALKEMNAEFEVLFTGQHYDRVLSNVFFEYFGMEVNYSLELRSSLVEEIERGAYEKLKELSPTVVVVLGDTNTVLAVSKAAKKLNIPLAHVEAGLRSFDKRMPEEYNRIETDKLSDFLFPPTDFSKRNLEIEKSRGLIKGEIYKTGNPIVDAVKFMEKDIKKDIVYHFGLEEGNYIVFTAHREENTAIYERLNNIIRVLERASEEYKVVFPLHPKTKQRLFQYRLSIPERNVLKLGPLPYLDMLALLKYSVLVITDSGGLQEEARSFAKPVFTLRDSTERQETILEGTNAVVGNHPMMFNFYFQMFLNRQWPLENSFSNPNPFGDGKAGERIAKFLVEKV